MSEKTLGELAHEAYTAKTKHLYKPWKPENQELCWQAAADAIAAPLLARIAELEGEVARLNTLCVCRGGHTEACAQLHADAPCDCAGGPCSPKERDAWEMYWKEHYAAKEAYQRGVAEERERAFTAGAIFGWDACENNWQEAEYEARKHDAIRSASPAVDVTSDKGGER